MTVWNDERLIVWGMQGGLTPYQIGNVNPASVDLCWSGRWRQYNAPTIATPEGWSEVQEWDRLSLQPGTLYLLDSLEYIKMPETASGTLCLKSSMGRKGLEHLHAGFFDPGFEGTATWEVHILIPCPLVVEKGQRLMQMVMQDCMQPLRSYKNTGRYNGQKEPTAAR